MPSRRPAALLAPLIALVLIGGVVAAVMGGSDPGGTDFAQQPEDLETTEPSTEPSPDAQPSASAEPTPGASSSPVPESSPEDDEAEAIASEQAIPPATAATQMPEPSASPTGSPGGTPAVQDPTALTGGWVGGTPNTGTAVSAAGLLLLALGAGLVWLRRART